MTKYQIITLIQRNIYIEKTIYHKDWRNNTIIGAEKITLLKLIEVIVKKTKYMSSRSIKADFNNRIVYRNIKNKLVKPAQYFQDRGAATTKIKKLTNNLQIRIKLIFTKHSKKVLFQ